MDDFQYFFDSRYLKFKLYDMQDKLCSISRLLGSKYSSKLKQCLDGIDIIDDKSICDAIISCMPKAFSIAHTAIPVPLEIYGAGLSYYIYNLFSERNVYRFVIYTCDPNVDLSFLLN
mgnify:CR=1 FL=1